jgi:hypothetical protein
VDQVSKKSEEYLSVLDSLTATTDKLLEDSPMLTDLDLDDPVQAREALLRLDKTRDSAEWFASLASVFAGVSRNAIASGDAMRAAWAATLMERFRAMMLFKTHLEEVVWMGHGARRLVEILRTWDANRTNADEEFWQITFSENAYVLSQVLGVPIVFIEGKAFVGGMTIEGKDSRFVDYLFAVESSGETVLVEIKTPVTPLLGKRKYRNVYQPSAELGGSIVQLLDYRSMWLRKYDSIARKPGTNLNAFNPRCVLLIGDAKSQFKNVEQRHAFELFRSNQKDVEIIAYDELFSKVRILASIFNLVQRPPDGGAAG